MSDVLKSKEKIKNSKVYQIKFMIKLYQADTVELDFRITHNHTYPYILTIVDHFSKYVFAYVIPDKKAEAIRNYMAQAFVIGVPVLLHTDNGKEFVNEF